MAQFDVHANVGRNRAAIPFVVVLQSKHFDASRRRIVAPLLDAAGFSAVSEVTPAFTIRRKRVVLDPFQIATVPHEALGERVGSLAGEADAAAVQRALDEVFARAYG
jgi:toxin CcdB